MCPSGAQGLERLQGGFDDAMAVIALPERYRKRLRTTNVPERLNDKTWRRERAIRIFPNEESAKGWSAPCSWKSTRARRRGTATSTMQEYWAWRAEQEAKAEKGTLDVNRDTQKPAA